MSILVFLVSKLSWHCYLYAQCPLEYSLPFDQVGYWAESLVTGVPDILPLLTDFTTDFTCRVMGSCSWSVQLFGNPSSMALSTLLDSGAVLRLGHSGITRLRNQVRLEAMSLLFCCSVSSLSLLKDRETSGTYYTGMDVPVFTWDMNDVNTRPPKQLNMLTCGGTYLEPTSSNTSRIASGPSSRR